ncbi:hypothetical protein [Rhodopila sp.]|uniref:hypothetical protein n=1 Tax=Rhodopila sp. TaxID=2480087 RepID=UPI003D0AB0EC
MERPDIRSFMPEDGEANVPFIQQNPHLSDPGGANRPAVDKERAVALELSGVAKHPDFSRRLMPKRDRQRRHRIGHRRQRHHQAEAQQGGRVEPEVSLDLVGWRLVHQQEVQWRGARKRLRDKAAGGRRWCGLPFYMLNRNGFIQCEAVCAKQLRAECSGMKGSLMHVSGQCKAGQPSIGIRRVRPADIITFAAEACRADGLLISKDLQGQDGPACDRPSVHGKIAVGVNARALDIHHCVWPDAAEVRGGSCRSRNYRDRGFSRWIEINGKALGAFKTAFGAGDDLKRNLFGLLIGQTREVELERPLPSLRAVRQRIDGGPFRLAVRSLASRLVADLHPDFMNGGRGQSAAAHCHIDTVASEAGGHDRVDLDQDDRILSIGLDFGMRGDHRVRHAFR